MLHAVGRHPCVAVVVHGDAGGRIDVSGVPDDDGGIGRSRCKRDAGQRGKGDRGADERFLGHGLLLFFGSLAVLRSIGRSPQPSWGRTWTRHAARNIPWTWGKTTNSKY